MLYSLPIAAEIWGLQTQGLQLDNLPFFSLQAKWLLVQLYTLYTGEWKSISLSKKKNLFCLSFLDNLLASMFIKLHLLAFRGNKKIQTVIML